MGVYNFGDRPGGFPDIANFRTPLPRAMVGHVASGGSTAIVNQHVPAGSGYLGENVACHHKYLKALPAEGAGGFYLLKSCVAP